MIQSGQNTLLVSSTLCDKTVELHADSNVYLKKNVKDLDCLKIFLSEYLLLNRNNPVEENKKVVINYLFSNILNNINLNMIKVSPLVKTSLEVLVKEINSGAKNLTNTCFLNSLKGNFLFANKFEFFGRIGKLQKDKKLTFHLQYRRRDSKSHAERFIGVGYKDKGTAKMTHLDGFHSWSEITSSYQSRLEHVTKLNSLRINFKIMSDQRVRKSLTVGSDNFGNPVRLHLAKYTDSCRVFWLEEVISGKQSICFSESGQQAIIRRFGTFAPIEINGRKGFIENSASTSLLSTIKRCN